MKKIKELLVDKSKWTARAYARNLFNEKVSSCDENACKWCLRGAAIKCYGFLTKEYFIVCKKIYSELDTVNIEQWNDKSDFEDVKNLVERLDI